MAGAVCYGLGIKACNDYWGQSMTDSFIACETGLRRSPRGSWSLLELKVLYHPIEEIESSQSPRKSNTCMNTLAWVGRWPVWESKNAPWACIRLIVGAGSASGVSDFWFVRISHQAGFDEQSQFSHLLGQPFWKQACWCPCWWRAGGRSPSGAWTPGKSSHIRTWDRSLDQVQPAHL